MMISKLVVVVLLCIAVSQGQNKSANAPAPDAWEPLRFLVGTWEANTQAGSAQAAVSGTYVFRLELRNHVLARHSNSGDCKGPADFDCQHNDLLYIYTDAPGQPFKAIYFDNEGHVIHYSVSTPAPDTAVFSSDPSQPRPQFRLIYEGKNSVLNGKFEIRMPGRTEFKSYLEWSGSKK